MHHFAVVNSKMVQQVLYRMYPLCSNTLCMILLQ